MTQDEHAAEEVRRLLAEARTTEPIPADVQARLEDTLGQLSAERSATPALNSTPAVPGDPLRDPTPVIDLASRRRRRAKTLLIAAAAVTVLGVALPRVLQDGFSPSASDDSADTAGAAAEDGGGETALEDAPASSTEPTDADAVPPRVRPGNFAADAKAARDQAERADLTGVTPVDPTCLASTDLTSDEISQLQSIPVRYGDLEATLVLGKASNGTQEATLYVCGESSPRRTTVLSDP